MGSLVSLLMTVVEEFVATVRLYVLRLPKNNDPKKNNN